MEEPSSSEDSRRHSFPRGTVTDYHPVVFRTSAVLIILFVILSLLFRDQALSLFVSVKDAITGYGGWFFILSVNVFLVLCIYLIFSERGRIRLGGEDAKPDFNYLTWLAMLFSAGMGIGLVFWSIAEPVYHFASPPIEGVEPEGERAAALAMTATYFHWGLHAWGIYALMGLSLAYFSYNRGLPLTIRSTLHPLLGDKTDGPWGNIVDILASIATLFGVATSLGFGVQQVNAGLSYALDVPKTALVQVLLIAGITLIATISVVTGVETGIRRLSEANMVMAFALLLFVFIAGPTAHLASSLLSNTWNYLTGLLAFSAWLPGSPERGWREGWTVFYWAWWIAWSPFVGMFIARISRGRTLRSFTIGVLLVPTVLTFIWLSIFGNAALFESLHGKGHVVDAVNDDMATALFALLDQFPLSQVTSLLSLAVIILFFVTSSDSGSLVIDIITSGGHTDPPVRQRVFWATMEGLVAAVLLVVGGDKALEALQTASVATGLPFALVILFVAYSLIRQTGRMEAPSSGSSA